MKNFVAVLAVSAALTLGVVAFGGEARSKTMTGPADGGSVTAVISRQTSVRMECVVPSCYAVTNDAGYSADCTLDSLLPGILSGASSTPSLFGKEFETAGFGYVAARPVTAPLSDGGGTMTCNVFQVFKNTVQQYR